MVLNNLNFFALDYLEPFQHISAIPEEVLDDREIFPDLHLNPNLMLLTLEKLLAIQRNKTILEVFENGKKKQSTRCCVHCLVLGTVCSVAPPPPHKVCAVHHHCCMSTAHPLALGRYCIIPSLQKVCTVLSSMLHVNIVTGGVVWHCMPSPLLHCHVPLPPEGVGASWCCEAQGGIQKHCCHLWNKVQGSTCGGDSPKNGIINVRRRGHSAWLEVMCGNFF